MKLKTYGILHHADLQDITDDLIEMLESAKDRLDRDAGDILSAGDYNNRDAEDFFQTAVNVFEYGVLQGEEKGLDVLGDDRAYAKVIGQAYEIAMAVFCLSDRELSDDLSDQDYRNFQDLADLHGDIVANLQDEEEDSRRGGRRDRGGRGRDRDRDDRGRGRGRSSRGGRRDRGGRGRGRDRDDYDDRDDRRERRGGRRGRGGNRGVSGVRTNYNTAGRGRDDYDDRDDRRDERPSRSERPARQQTELVDAVTVSQPKVVLAEKSRIVPNYVPGPAHAWMYNPERHAAVHAGTDNGNVYETIFEKEKDVEAYKDHEIKRAGIAVTSNGGVVVPQVDFRKMPDLATPEEEAVATAAKILQVKPLSICVNSRHMDIVGHEASLLTDADYTIAKVDTYRPISAPVCIMDKLAGADQFSTFESWYNVMTLIQEQLPSMSKTEHYQATAFLTLLEDELKLLFNNMLAIVLTKTAYVDSFIGYFRDAMTHLKHPDQADDYARWTSLEREYIRHNFAMLSTETRDKLTEQGILKPDMNDTDTYRYLWFKSQVIAVRAQGDLLAEGLQFSNRNLVALVEYKYTPDFYSACERLVNFRNKNLKMSSIMLFDAVGNQMMVLAGTESGGVIKARRL